MMEPKRSPVAVKSGVARCAAWSGAALAVWLSACAPSNWESSFDPAPGVTVAEKPSPGAAEARLREVPWQRLDETLHELESERISSDIHPDEWPAEKRDAAQARLLRGLQISHDPGRVQVLGRSQFKTTEPTRPDDGELQKLSQRVGATTVVWSSTYLGKADTIVQEPVTEQRDGWYTDRGRDGRRRTDSFSETTTYWVPVRVQADEHAWVAYFLREF